MEMNQEKRAERNSDGPLTSKIYELITAEIREKLDQLAGLRL